jgi:hypothetical protein
VFVNRFTVWDELVNGAAADPGWLGLPTEPAVWTALMTADLLDGAGVRMPSAWIDELVLTGASATRVAGPAVRLVPVAAADFTMTFTVADFAGGDLVVAATVRTDASTGLPSGVPRVASVRIRSGPASKHYVAAGYQSIRAYARDLPHGDVRVQFSFPAGPAAQVRSLRAYAAADAGYRLFDNGAVFANPSQHPYTFDVGPLGSFVRLTATAGQDSTVNDGSPVGASLTVAPADAILVRRAAPP